MGLTQFNSTILRPANEVIFDASLTGDSITMNYGIRSGWFKYSVEGLDGSVYYNNTSINLAFPDASDRNLRVYKGGTSGGNGVYYINIFSEYIKSLNFSKLKNLNQINLSAIYGCEEIIMPDECEPNAFYDGIFISNTDVSYLDLSAAVDVGNAINIRDNDSLENIILPIKTPGSDPISNLSIYNNALYGTLDVSTFTNLGNNATIALSNNNLDSILFPETSSNINNLNISFNNISGTVDLSKMTGLYDIVRLNSNNTISHVIFPDSSADWNLINLGYNSLLTIDISNLIGFVDDVRLNNNSLTSVLLADSSIPMSYLDLSYNPDLITLDVSNRIFQGTLNLNNNTSLTNLYLPEPSCYFSSFSLYRCPIPGVLDVSNHYFSGNIQLSSTDISTFLFDPSKALDITGFYARNSNVETSLNFKPCKKLKNLSVEQSYLSGIVYPDDASVINIDISSTDAVPASGIVDLSMLQSIKSLGIRLTDASVILWPYDVSITNLWEFVADGCELADTLDLSMFPSLEANLDVYSNKRLKTIILPPNPNTTYPAGGFFRANDCSLEGSLDLSNLIIAGRWTIQNNSGLTSITMPLGLYSNTYWYEGRFNDCSLNQTTIDNILSTFSDFFETATIYTNFTLALEGGGNAAPTDGSLNVDISTLEYLFSQSTKTLTLTYNT